MIVLQQTARWEGPLMRLVRSRPRQRLSVIGYRQADVNSQINLIRARVHWIETSMQQEQKAFQSLYSQKLKFQEQLLQQLGEILEKEDRTTGRQDVLEL
jgi:hypothetical protein